MKPAIQTNVVKKQENNVRRYVGLVIFAWKLSDRLLAKIIGFVVVVLVG